MNHSHEGSKRHSRKHTHHRKNKGRSKSSKSISYSGADSNSEMFYDDVGNVLFEILPPEGQMYDRPSSSYGSYDSSQQIRQIHRPKVKDWMSFIPNEEWQSPDYRKVTFGNSSTSAGNSKQSSKRKSRKKWTNSQSVSHESVEVKEMIDQFASALSGTMSDLYEKVTSVEMKRNYPRYRGDNPYREGDDLFKYQVGWNKALHTNPHIKHRQIRDPSRREFAAAGFYDDSEPVNLKLFETGSQRSKYGMPSHNYSKSQQREPYSLSDEITAAYDSMNRNHHNNSSCKGCSHTEKLWFRNSNNNAKSSDNSSSSGGNQTDSSQSSSRTSTEVIKASSSALYRSTKPDEESRTSSNVIGSSSSALYRSTRPDEESIAASLWSRLFSSPGTKKSRKSKKSSMGKTKDESGSKSVTSEEGESADGKSSKKSSKQDKTSSDEEKSMTKTELFKHLWRSPVTSNRKSRKPRLVFNANMELRSYCKDNLRHLVYQGEILCELRTKIRETLESAGYKIRPGLEMFIPLWKHIDEVKDGLPLRLPPIVILDSQNKIKGYHPGGDIDRPVC